MQFNNAGPRFHPATDNATKRRREKKTLNLTAPMWMEVRSEWLRPVKKKEKMSLSDDDECASIWISREKKTAPMQWKERREKIQFSRFPLCWNVRHEEPLLIYTHYIITIFSLFARSFFSFLSVSLLFGRIGWLQLSIRVCCRRSFFSIFTLCGPFYLSFSFILFLLSVSGVIFT